MKNIIWILLAFLFFFQVCPGQSRLDKSKAFIHPFEKISSKTLQKYVKEELKDNRLLGLGEVSHYTRECYQFKHEIIKMLMNEGYEALILEVDFGQALIWNQYVTQGKGNLDTIIAQSGWFTYRTEEFKEVVRDIKAYNDQASTPFQIIGMEMTAMNHNLDWLKQYVLENREGQDELLPLLEKERKIVAFQQYTEEERIDYWTLYFAMKNFLETHEQALLAKSGEGKFSIALHIAEITRQYATYISQDDFSLKSEFRDQFSARNVIWGLNEMGEGSKAIIWAHNGHVAKQSLVFNYDILGHYLKRWFGEAYYSIGFTFNQGEFGAYSNEGFKRWKMEPIDTSSLTLDLHKMSSPYLIFNIRANLSTDRELGSWLRKDQLMRRDISESFNESWPKYMNVNLSKTYDALIYIEETSFPTAIEWAR